MDIRNTNKMGMKEMLEMAGCDVTSAKSVALIEAADNLDAMKAELKTLTKELVDARSGGNDDVAENLKGDIEELKEKIKAAQS